MKEEEACRYCQEFHDDAPAMKPEYARKSASRASNELSSPRFRDLVQIVFLTSRQPTWANLQAPFGLGEVRKTMN